MTSLKEVNLVKMSNRATSGPPAGYQRATSGLLRATDLENGGCSLYIWSDSRLGSWKPIRLRLFGKNLDLNFQMRPTSSKGFRHIAILGPLKIVPWRKTRAVFGTDIPQNEGHLVQGRDYLDVAQFSPFLVIRNGFGTKFARRVH